MISKLTQGWIKLNSTHIRIIDIEAVKYDAFYKRISIDTCGGNCHECKITNQQHDDLHKLLDIPSNTLLIITSPDELDKEL